tara:strand:+ start:133 stop:369 length:237 start_codon:yes stop_codon:yes gene_type:complete
MSEQETPIKEWLTNYIGEKESPEDSEVTVEMIVKHMAKEFPEFLMVVAEENWVRGYRQALVDVDRGRQAQNNEEPQTI